MRSCKKLNESFCMCALCGTYPYPVSVSDLTDFFQNPLQLNKIVMKQVGKKMPRLNNDERNQTIGMLNAGMSATVVSRHFGCTRKDYRAFTETIPCHRNRSGRPRVTTAADDRYIVLQHLRNRRLTAAATGRQYGIHPQTVRNRLRQNVQPIRSYRPYFCQILTRRHRTARRD